MKMPNERGVALILVMGVLALISVWAIASIEEDWLLLHRAERMVESTRAILAVESGLEWAKIILRKDATEGEVDSLNDEWAQQHPPFSLDEGVLYSSIVDANRFFNLNNLVDNKGRPRQNAIMMARRLFRHVGVDPLLVDALVDWMDKDEVPFGQGGAEAPSYFDKLYRIKNAPLDRLEELLLIKGFDRDVLNALRKVVIVRPSNALTPININTAQPEVLRSLADGIPSADVEAILQERRLHPFQKVLDLASRKQFASWMKQVDRSMLTTKSDAFVVRLEARFGPVRWKEEALCARKGKKVALIFRQRVADLW